MFTFNTTPIFQANWEATEDIIVNQGGTDSGKTFAILQVASLLCSTTKAPDVDPIFTILSESIPNSKKGVWRTIQTILRDKDFAKTVRHINEGDRIVYFHTGWVMEFVGATDEQNAKQGKRQYLYVNEANGITWQIFWQMAKRTRIRTWIDYNPNAPFWVHDNLTNNMGAEKESSISIDSSRGNDLYATVIRIISDHRHNTFLSAIDHDKTENIKNPDLHKVYARGLTGNLSGLIFTSWQKIADKDFPWDASGKFAGQDFGYTNDPSAGVRMVKQGKNIFCHELCYEPGISVSQLKAIYKANKFTSENPIYCDHDNDMIREMRKAGLLAIQMRKGPGSVNAGILKLNKDYNVFYTESSTNIDFERKRYMWLKDLKSGKFINEPIDEYNHTMDAIRGAAYTKYFRVA